MHNTCIANTNRIYIYILQHVHAIYILQHVHAVFMQYTSICITFLYVKYLLTKIFTFEIVSTFVRNLR